LERFADLIEGFQETEAPEGSGTATAAGSASNFKGERCCVRQWKSATSSLLEASAAAACAPTAAEKEDCQAYQTNGKLECSDPNIKQKCCHLCTTTTTTEAATTSTAAATTTTAAATTTTAAATTTTAAASTTAAPVKKFHSEELPDIKDESTCKSQKATGAEDERFTWRKGQCIEDLQKEAASYIPTCHDNFKYRTPKGNMSCAKWGANHGRAPCDVAAKARGWTDAQISKLKTECCQTCNPEKYAKKTFGPAERGMWACDDAIYSGDGDGQSTVYVGQVSGASDNTRVTKCSHLAWTDTRCNNFNGVTVNSSRTAADSPAGCWCQINMTHIRTAEHQQYMTTAWACKFQKTLEEKDWDGVINTADGRRIIAWEKQNIWISNDFGKHWKNHRKEGDKKWQPMRMAISANGKTMSAIEVSTDSVGGGMYKSFNGGKSWTTIWNSPARWEKNAKGTFSSVIKLRGVGISGDGTTVTAIESGGEMPADPSTATNRQVLHTSDQLLAKAEGFTDGDLSSFYLCQSTTKKDGVRVCRESKQNPVQKQQHEMYDIAMDATGQRLLVGTEAGYVLEGSNQGEGWWAMQLPDVAGSNSTLVARVAASDDFRTRAAAVFGGKLYVAQRGTRDYVPAQVPEGNVAYNISWSCLGMNGPGNRIIAGENPGYLYLSKDYGATFVRIGTSNPWMNGEKKWKSVTLSWDGSHIAAVEGKMEDGVAKGYVWKSQDYGNTWSAVNYLEPETCESFSCPRQWVDKKDKASKRCGGTSCSEFECCNQVCTGYDCKSPYSKKEDHDGITCADGRCHISECCQDRSTCASFTCPEGMTAKKDVEHCATTTCKTHDCCSGAGNSTASSASAGGH
jgi:hypothetical protein